MTVICKKCNSELLTCSIICPVCNHLIWPHYALFDMLYSLSVFRFYKYSYVEVKNCFFNYYRKVLYILKYARFFLLIIVILTYLSLAVQLWCSSSDIYFIIENDNWNKVNIIIPVIEKDFNDNLKKLRSIVVPDELEDKMFFWAEKTSEYANNVSEHIKSMEETYIFDSVIEEKIENVKNKVVGDFH